MSVQKLQMASHAKQRREVLSESRMREICLSGSMIGERKRSVAEWPKLPRLSSTLPLATEPFSPSADQCPLLPISDKRGCGRIVRFVQPRTDMSLSRSAQVSFACD